MSFFLNWSNDKVKRLSTNKKDIHVKYQTSRTHCSKVISKVKVFKKWVKLQGQGHRVIKIWYPRKGLTTGNIHVKYPSSSTYCQKLLARLKFQRGGQNDRRTKTICPPIFDLRGHIKHLLHYWQLKKKYKSLTRMLQYKGCITPMKQLKF